MCVCVCVCAKFDQFLPARSQFDSKRPENFVCIATFPSATFGPLFAFHCPLLFFTKNNNLEWKSSRFATRDVLKTVTISVVTIPNFAMRYVSRYLGHDAIRIAILVYRVRQCLDLQFVYHGNAIYMPRCTLLSHHNRCRMFWSLTGT